MNNNVVVLTGCFDALHRGHIELLQFAKSQFNGKAYVIVFLDSDQKVRKDKGEFRPIHIQEDRKFFLEYLPSVDKVVIFDSEEDLIDGLKIIKPAIRICGSDWKGKKIVGEEHCGEVLFFDRVRGFSSTNIINGVKNGIRI